MIFCKQLNARDYFKMKLSLLTLLIICLLISCNSSNSEMESKAVKDIDSTSVISMRLKGGERMLLNYADIFFQLKELIFSNPGKTDTVITHKINSNFKTILSSRYVVLNGFNTNTQSFYVFLNPGDSLYFTLKNGKDLAIDTTQTNRPGSFTQGYYYDDFANSLIYVKSGRHKIDFSEFYSLLNESHRAETERIGMLVISNKINESTASVWRYNSEVFYYKYLFQYIAKEDKLDREMSKIYTSHLEMALNLFKRQPTTLSHNLRGIFEGILKVKLLNENRNFRDYSEVIKKAIEVAPDPLRPSLLCGLIREDTKEDENLQILLDYIVKEYPNTKYSSYVEDLKNKTTELSNMKIDDTLMSLSNQVILWDDYLLQSDKYFIIDFWASWCAPCRALFPLMDSVKPKFANKNIEFVSVNIDRDINDWKVASKAESKYLETNNYYLFQNRKASLMKKYTINSIPRIMIFKNGKVVSNNFFLPSEPGFVDELNKMVNK